MGQKVIQASVALSLLAAVMTLVCCSQVWHQGVWSAFGIPAVITIETSAFSIKVNACGGGTTTGALLKSISTLCHHVREEWENLQTFSHKTCSGVVSQFFPSMCTATSNAYVLGMVVVIVSVTNAILQVIAAWMAYEYIAGKKKAQYRKLFIGLMGIGTFLQAGSIFVYQFVAMAEMDGMSSRIPALAPGQGAGIRPPFVLMYVALIVHGISILLTGMAKVSQEDIEAERRANAKFRQEVDAYTETEAAVNSGSGQGYGYGSAAAGDMLAGGGYAQPQPWGAQQPPQQWGAQQVPQPWGVQPASPPAAAW